MTRTSKPRRRWARDRLYKVKILLVRGGNSDAEGKRFAALFGEPYEADPPEPAGRFLCCDDRNVAMLWLADGPHWRSGAAEAAHECLHAALWALRNAGLRFGTGQCDEALCYYVEWLMGEVSQLFPRGFS